MGFLARSCFLIVGALSILTLSCAGNGEDAAPQIVRPVKYLRVSQSGEERVRTFSGTARADQESKLSFKVAGTISHIPVKVGDRVRRGQLLAELDPKDYRIKVREAEAGLERAKAASRNAEAVYGRIQALWASEHVSRNDLDAARAASESAASAVRAAEQQLELARSQLGYARLTAPVDGEVAAVIPQENENIAPGYPVAVLTSGTMPEAHIAAPENLIGFIRKGSAATVSFTALPNRTFAGTVSEVGVAVTGPFATYPVTVRLTETAPQILSGMAAEVAISCGAEGGAVSGIRVPPQAVGQDRKGKFVYVVEPSGADRGIARRRVVRTGGLDADGLDVVEGVRDGELVVTAGVSRIEDGTTVRLLK